MGHDYEGSGNYMVAEFGARRRLAKLGFTSSLDDVDEVYAQLMIEISVALDKEEERKANSKGMK